MSKDLGSRIKVVREALGLTLEELHQRLRPSFKPRPATVSAWEHGETIPDRGTLRLIADLTTQPDAVLLWLEHGGRDRPEVKLAQTEAAERAAKRAGNQVGNLSLQDVRLERQAGVVARVVAKALHDALVDSAVSTTHRGQVALAHALQVFGDMLTELGADAGGIKTVARLMRDGEL